MSRRLRSWMEQGSVEIVVLVLLASLIFVLAIPLFSDLGTEPVNVISQ